MREKLEGSYINVDHFHSRAGCTINQRPANLTAFTDGVIVGLRARFCLMLAGRAVGIERHNFELLLGGKASGNQFHGVHLGGSLVGNQVLRRKPRGVNIQICQEMRNV